MSSNRRIAAALVVAAGMSCGAQIAVADESGSFTAIASMIRNYTTIEHAGGTIIGGVSEGTYTVLESSGGPFVAGEHSQVTCVIHGKRSAAGIDLVSPCTSTTAAGDKSYLVSKRSAGDVEEGGGGIGRLELVGGTGIYAGVTGTCTYKTNRLPGERPVCYDDGLPVAACRRCENNGLRRFHARSVGCRRLCAMKPAAIRFGVVPALTATVRAAQA